MDMPSMEPCPAAKCHSLHAILPEEPDGFLTFFCQRCGALRRVPLSGALVPESLDPLTPEQIIAAIVRG